MADPAKVVVVLMAIDGGRWWPPTSATGPGSLGSLMGNAIFLRNQKGDANNVDVYDVWMQETTQRIITFY